MSHHPAEELNADEQLLEELLVTLGADERADLTALRLEYAGEAQQFDQLLHAARLYLAGRDDLRDDSKRTEALAAGTMLGDFEIIALLGRGGMGEVYRARQHSLGQREVALKVLAIQLRQAKARARFQREALLLAGLHHPGLAEVYGFGEEHGEPFLAMRLVDGIDLRSLQREWKSFGVTPTKKLEQVVSWGTQVAEALALVHDSGLVHRDVKPSNIIIEGNAIEREPSGRAVLVDFGLARPVDTEVLTLASGSPATLEYAPPEQILGQPVGPSADVFALGVTLHDALTGRAPGERPRAAGGLRSLQELDPEFDRDLAAVIARAVDPEARWRYPDAAHLHADLIAWQEGQPVSARKRSWRERLERGLKDHPGRVSGVLFGLVLCALVLRLAAGLGTQRATVVEAREALNHGDLARASSVIKEVEDSWQHSALGWSEGLRDFVKRSRNSPDSSSLARVVQRLDAGDVNGALYAGAEAMRLRGIENEELILRWWCAGLLEGSGITDVWERQAWTQRLSLTARLFCERPCQTLEQRAAAAPVREALLELDARGELSPEERLFLLSAISGCGTADDIPWLIERMIALPDESEEARLACMVVDMLLRFLAVSDDLERVDFEGIWRSLADSVGPILARGTDCIRYKKRLSSDYRVTDYAQSLALLTQTLAFAEQRAGKSSMIHTVLPEAWWPVLRQGSERSLQLLLWTARSADPRIREAMLGLEGLQSWRENPNRIGYDLGNLAGVTPDLELVARLRERCAELSPPGWDTGLIQAIFDQQVYGRARWSEATEIQTYLDADSLLGAPLKVSDTWRILRMKPARHASSGRVATWDFDKEAPQETGTALSVRLRGFEQDQSAHARYLIGRRPGLSEVELHYRGPGLAKFARASLNLRHLAARRDQFPHRGRVLLQVRVDGQLVADGLAVACETGEANYFESVALPLEALEIGEHAISIRIDPRSTTTYRLLGVELTSR